MLFEWDNEKRESNLDKHGVDFSRAVLIFRNPVLERPHDRKDYGEDRWRAVGHWKSYYMIVIYPWRGETRPIISAWKAGKNEQEEYNRRIAG